jgi:hypothetical protein
MASTQLAPSDSAWVSSRAIAWLRDSVASVVSAEISPPNTCWQPAQAVPITLRERTVMPQHGPSTSSIRIPGGASNVVRMGMRCTMAVGAGKRAKDNEGPRREQWWSPRPSHAIAAWETPSLPASLVYACVRGRDIRARQLNSPCWGLQSMLRAMRGRRSVWLLLLGCLLCSAASAHAQADDQPPPEPPSTSRKPRSAPEPPAPDAVARDATLPERPRDAPPAAQRSAPAEEQPAPPAAQRSAAAEEQTAPPAAPTTAQAAAAASPGSPEPPPPPAKDGDYAGSSAPLASPEEDFDEQAVERFHRSPPREYSVRIDVLNWLLLGRFGIELEATVWKFISAELIPTFVTAEAPIALNYARFDDGLTQHSNGLGPISGVRLGLGFWLSGEAFRGYVLRLDFSNNGYIYRSEDRQGLIDRVEFTERRVSAFFGSQSRFGPFTFAGGFGLGFELNQVDRCGLAYVSGGGGGMRVTGRSDDCNGKQLIALDRTLGERADLNGPLHPVYFEARFSLGVVF